MLFGSEGIVGIAFPIFVEGLEPEDGHLVGPAEVHELLEVAGRVGDVGLLGELGRGGGPARFCDDERDVGQDRLDFLEIFDGVGEGVVDGLVFPERVGVDGEEVEVFGEGGSVLAEHLVVVGGGDGLGDGGLNSLEVGDHRVERDEVVVPGDEGLVAHVHGDDDIGKLVGEADAAFDFGPIAGLILREDVIRSGLGDPGAAFVVAQLGIEPDSQHDFEGDLVVSDEAKDVRGILLTVV